MVDTNLLKQNLMDGINERNIYKVKAVIMDIITNADETHKRAIETDFTLTEHDKCEKHISRSELVIEMMKILKEIK